MPKFVYKAKKGLEDVFEGMIEADSKEQALNLLIDQGLFPINIVDESEYVPEKKGVLQREGKKAKRRKKRISSKEILNFTQKLATLSRAKVELLSSLKILYEQTENAKFQDIILDVYNVIKEGKTFSEGLMRYPEIFSPLFINIIKAGEASGRLDISLDQITDFLYRDESLKTKVYVALAYPALLLLVGIASVFVLINFVIPRLLPIFESLGKDLPLITKIVLNLSFISSKNIWVFFTAAGIFLVFTTYSAKGKALFKELLGKLKRGFPIVRRLTKNQELAHLSRALAMLLKSGVPALKSLEIATPGIDDPKLREDFKKVCRAVAAGQELSKSMETYTNLPPFFIKMIAVGEQSGRLTDVLGEISASYTQQTEADVAMITSLIEPVLILIMGIILGAIVLAILLPTFQITQIVS
ncbi:MAG: type II secretion system F family protein [Candidatus Omnitrophica bacterium]|nr:type II secretion system F family protein [Candidatus Omnitrophota bacterium]